MEMPGFREVLPKVVEIEVMKGFNLKVCSLEGIVLLKLVAYDANPQRTKDIIDIDHIIAVYFDLNDIEIYEDYMDVMDEYDISNIAYLRLISARIIGRKIGTILDKSILLKKAVINIARKRLTETWQALADGLGDTIEHN